jgi:hypothetical protein
LYPFERNEFDGVIWKISGGEDGRETDVGVENGSGRVGLEILDK